jgi:hypothetical protein
MATSTQVKPKPNGHTPPPVMQVRLELPLHVFEQYAQQAEKTGQGKIPEQVMVDRLLKCAEQHDAGLWLTAAEKKRLEACVGHMVNDGQGALQRLEPLSRITIEGLTFQIDPIVLKRLSTRTRRGQTLEQLIKEQVQRALKQYVGLLPY